MLSGDSFMRSLVQENDVYLNLNQFNKEALEYANDKSHKDIVKEYLQYSGNCSELLNLLQGGRKSASQLATIFNTIECILLRISGDLNSYENVGREIVQKILQFNINCIYNLLKPANKSNQVKSALKLLIAICTQGIQSIKDLIVNFNFQNTSFLSIINRRNIKDPEDIRTCFIHFVVAILIIGDNTIIKNVIELKGFLNLVIHGLIYDRALIIHLILSTIQKRIVENSSISKTQKIRVLNDDTLKFVLKLYNWSGEKVNKFTNKRKHNSDLKEEIFVEKPASEEEINFVRDTAHQFMLSVCCSYKNGIIFSNWISNNNEKNPNHIITNLLKSLKTPYADKRSSDFIIKVLQTCPDQIKFYLPSLQDSFFPRNSVAWIQIMNLLKEIVISQNPLQLLLKPDGKLSISKVASQVIQFCIPSVLSKIIITENLKSYDPIIQYVLLDYLHILLKKLKNILEGNKLEFLSVGYNTDDFESFKTIVKENTFINFPDSSSVYCCLEDLVENIGKHYQKTAKIQEVLPIYNVVQHFQKIVEILELFGELYPNTFKENPLKIKTFLLEIRKYSSILKDQTVILEISILKLLLMFKHTSDLKEIEEFPFSFLLEVYLKTKDKNLLICSLKILKEFLFEFGFSEDSFWELNIWLKKLKYSSFSCHEKIVNFLEKVMKFAFNKSSYLENIITDCKKKILSTNILSDKYNNDIKEGEMKPFSILVPACLESLKTISSEDIKDVKYYLTEVLQEILHCQKEPKLLCSLLQQYDVLPSEFMNYINIWIPGFKFKNNILQISLSEELFINISALESFKTIYIHSKRSDILLYEKKIYKNFKLFVKKVENWEELQSVIRQIVFYITIEIQNEEINKDTVLLLLNFLNIIISIIQKKNDDRSFENINESDNISFSILLKDILSYSSVVYWFFTNELYQSELCAKLSSQLICFILNLITFINECSKLHKEIILKPYKYKLISWLQLNAAVLIKKKYIFKIITFETLINGFIHVLQPEEAKEILLVITKLDLLQIQKIDPECSVFIALLKCCLKDKTIDLMKFSDFRITYFHLLSLNLERNEIDELIDCALQMMQTHPNNLYSLDIELLIPLLRKLTLKTLHFIQLLLQHNSLSFKQILSFLSTEHQCMTQWSPQLIMNFINSCINIVSPKGKSLKKFLEIVSPYYWLIIKKVVKAKHENSEMNEITACNILSKLLQLNIIDKEKVVSLTEKICSNIDDNNMPLLFSTSIIIELFYSVEILKLNTKSVPAETALFMVLIKWLLYHLKEKSEVNESIIEIIMKLTDLSKKMDSNSLREILSDTLWSSVLQTLLKRGLNDLNNGNLMIQLLNIIIFTLYENNNMNISPSISVIFQMVFGHSNFISLILEDAKTCLTKESVVSLLITLVTIDCSVCNSEHIPLYLGAYQATMNKTDQSLLFLISLYENAGIQLTRYRPFLWGPIGINHYSLKEKSNLSLWKEPKIDDVINLLDNEKIWYSVLNFPLNLDLNPAVQELDEIELELDKIYDPRFLLSLFASLLIPGYLVNCKKFIEYKCLAFVFASLSSSVPNIRKIGYYILYLFHEHLEGSRFREKDIWLGILKLIKYNIGKSNVKLSCIVSLFLCKITHYAFKSEDPMYKPLMQFLTLKPTLDLFNVPEFYKFFNSSNIVNNVEQEWILNHLKEGLRTSFDFHTCEQRYIFRILLAFYSSPVCNQFLKLLILNILIQAVKIPLVARQMHKKYGLLTWIINVIYNGKPSEEEITKLKLIVNILQKNIIQMTESIQSEIV